MMSGQERVMFACQQMLLKMYHCTRCTVCDGARECKFGQECIVLKEMIVHMKTCNKGDCPMPGCAIYRGVVNHYATCSSWKCGVCVPVRCALTTGKIEEEDVMVVRQLLRLSQTPIYPPAIHAPCPIQSLKPFHDPSNHGQSHVYVYLGRR
jgi:hypothetical protein